MTAREIAETAYSVLPSESRVRDIVKAIGTKGSAISQIAASYVALNGEPWKTMPVPVKAVKPSPDSILTELESLEESISQGVDEIKLELAREKIVAEDFCTTVNYRLTAIENTLVELVGLLRVPVKIKTDLPPESAEVVGKPIAKHTLKVLVVGLPATQKQSLLNRFKATEVDLTLQDSFKANGTAKQYDWVFGAQTMGSGFDIPLRTTYSDKYRRISSGGANTIIKYLEDALAAR